MRVCVRARMPVCVCASDPALWRRACVQEYTRRMERVQSVARAQVENWERIKSILAKPVKGAKK